MKTTNIIKAFSWLCMALFLLSACENDGDLIYLSSPTSSELMASKSEVVLLQENASQTAVSFSWTKSTVTISDESVDVADDQITSYLEASITEDFSSTIGESLVTNLRKDYTVAELNTLATNIGLQPNVAQTVYFRLGVTTGNNMDRVYGNVTTIKVTTYEIDMTIGYLLNKDSNDKPGERYGITLSSPNADGVYSGFVGATGWMAFFFEEGDGTIWGNDNDGDETGTAFEATSEDHKWNFWFPGTGGSYYTIIDTNKEEWSALLLPSLNVSGSLGSFEMEFDRANNTWWYTFNASSATTVNIQISTTAQQYDVSTGTDTAKDTPIAFVQDGDKLALANQAANISVSVPTTGECTLIIDLNDPNNWTYKIVAGGYDAESTPEYLFLPGIDGSWSSFVSIPLYDELNPSYAGVVNVNASVDGYQILIEKDNWGDIYGWETGDAYSGTIIYKDGENMPIPTPGLYLMNISTKELTYELLEIGNEVYVQGLDDIWKFDMPLTKISTGVYKGFIKFESVSEWGFRINLKNGDWDNYRFGGTDGKLYYEGDAMTDDENLAPGTYTMTVDLINETYTIE